MNAYLTFIAEEDSSSWINIAITLLILFFMIIGPILKKVTEGIRKNIAKSRGVIEPKESDRPPPRNPQEAVINIFDGIAEVFEKARKTSEKPAKKTFDRSPSKLVEPGQHRRDGSIRSIESERREKGRKQRRFKAPDAPEPVTYTARPAARRAYKGFEEISAPVAPVEKTVGKISTVQSIKILGTIAERKKAQAHVDIWKALPSHLSDNQRAIVIAEILGSPKSLSETVKPWEVI